MHAANVGVLDEVDDNADQLVSLDDVCSIKLSTGHHKNSCEMFPSHLRCMVASIVAVAAFSTHYANSVSMQHFTVNIYGNETHEISPILFGVFFEEVHSPTPQHKLQAFTRKRAHDAVSIIVKHCIIFRPVLPCLLACAHTLS